MFMYLCTLRGLKVASGPKDPPHPPALIETKYTYVVYLGAIVIYHHTNWALGILWCDDFFFLGENVFFVEIVSSYHFGVLESNDALLNDFEPFYEE